MCSTNSVVQEVHVYLFIVIPTQLDNPQMLPLLHFKDGKSIKFMSEIVMYNKNSSKNVVVHIYMKAICVYIHLL